MKEDVFNVVFLFWSCLLQGHTCWYLVLLDFLNKKKLRHISKGRFFYEHRSEITRNRSIFSFKTYFKKIVFFHRSELTKYRSISSFKTYLKRKIFFSQVRINQELEHFLINPFGLNYGEITASSLVKVDMQGDVIEKGTTTLGINRAGFTLHSAIHQARPDLKCVIHLHTPAAVAVSLGPIYLELTAS